MSKKYMVEFIKTGEDDGQDLGWHQVKSPWGRIDLKFTDRELAEDFAQAMNSAAYDRILAKEGGYKS